jgi:hypothetical protein
MNKTETFQDRLLTHKLDENDYILSIICDYNLFLTDLQIWFENGYKALSTEENNIIFTKIYNEIENNKYSNEFLFSSVYLYAYTVFGLVEKDKDGFNFVKYENLSENWVNEIALSNFDTIFFNLLGQYHSIFKEVRNEEDLNNFNLDGYNFNKTAELNNGFKFEHHKNVKTFDKLVELLNVNKETNTVRNNKIGELYLGVFVKHHPIGVVSIIDDNILVNLCAFGDDGMDFIGVRYNNKWYKIKLKIDTSNEKTIVNYLNSTQLGKAGIIDYDSITEEPRIEEIAIKRVYLDSLENPDEDGWNQLNEIFEPSYLAKFTN